MRKITRRDALKVLGATGLAMGGVSAKISGVDKLLDGGGWGSLGIGMHESYGADTIKPGTVINSGNYKNFPQLKELLPEHQYLRLKKGETRSDLPEINIVPTRKLQLTAPDQKWMEKNRGTVTMDPETKRLVNWQAGIPFPEPKNADEVCHNFINRKWDGDAFHFINVTFRVLDRLNRAKDMDALLWQRPFKGRTTVPPVPEYPDNPENVLWKQTFSFIRPYDVAGNSILRVRYDSYDKDDDMWAYIPAMRRIRRYTGADVQDPLFGSDNTFDDFGHWIQKIDFKTVVPTKVEEGQLLTHGYPDVNMDGHNVKTDVRQLLYPIWEIRPVYILTVDINDPTYMYNKRITWIDKETNLGLYFEGYDQKGNLFRSWMSGYWWTPEGGHQWVTVDIEDWINGSKTYLLCKDAPYNSTFSDTVFTKGFIKRAVR